MSTAVCPGCGAGLDAGARLCPKCGKPRAEPGIPAAPSAPASSGAGGKKLPVVPIAIFAVGLLALVGALTMMRSSPRPGAELVPAQPASPAVSPPVAAASATPVLTIPAVPTVPVASTRSPAVAFPGTPPPPPSDVQPAGAKAAAPAAAPVAPKALSTRVWKDPPDTAGSPAPADVSARGGSSAPAPERTVPISKTYECRESAVFNVDPEETVVTVDGRRIGTADDWDDAGGGKKYKFQGPGVHYVKLTLEEYETMWLKFVVSSDAKKKTADVGLDMKKRHR